MELEEIRKFYETAREIEGLISNAYVASVDSDGVSLQGKFNRALVDKYRGTANFVIGERGFIQGQLEIGGLQIRLIFD